LLSPKLLQDIEAHGDVIARNILRAIRHDPGLVHLAKLPDQELRERGQEILKNLSHWLIPGRDEGLAHNYEELGRERFEEGVPLHEAVRALCIMRVKMIEFLDEQGTDRDSVELYAEEQFERRLGRFFDFLLVHLVRGYETAWRRAAHLAA
jgi:hypothetical protein